MNSFVSELSSPSSSYPPTNTHKQSTSLYIKLTLKHVKLYVQVHILKECNKASTFHTKRIKWIPWGSDCGQRLDWSSPETSEPSWLSVHPCFGSPLQVNVDIRANMISTSWGEIRTSETTVSMSGVPLQNTELPGWFTVASLFLRVTAETEEDWFQPLWGLPIRSWMMRPPSALITFLCCLGNIPKQKTIRLPRHLQCHQILTPFTVLLSLVKQLRGSSLWEMHEHTAFSWENKQLY